MKPISLPTAMELKSPHDTGGFGRRLGGLLRAGDLVILSGALGAGKTALAKGIGAGLGVVGTVMSPTFVIARVHRNPDPARPDLVHVDAYRLGGLAEFDDLDLDVELESAAVVVEWGEGLADRLAVEHLHLHLDRRDDDGRVVTVRVAQGDWPQRLALLFGS